MKSSVPWLRVSRQEKIVKRIKFAAAALNQTPIDWQQNADNIVAAIEAPRKQHADILCLPELCIPGYGCEDAFLAEGVRETALEILLQIIPETQGIAVAIGLPIEVAGDIYNVVAMVVDGQLKGLVAKQNLAGDGLHYEPRWFTPWEAAGRRQLRLRVSRFHLGICCFMSEEFGLALRYAKMRGLPNAQLSVLPINRLESFKPQCVALCLW